MKKTLYVLLGLGLAYTLTSCRDENIDSLMDGDKNKLNLITELKSEENPIKYPIKK